MVSVQWWPVCEAGLSPVHTVLMQLEVKLVFGSVKVSFAVCPVTIVWRSNSGRCSQDGVQLHRGNTQAWPHVP